MPSEPISFTNDDGFALAGRLDLPDRPPLATAIFAHCFTCSKNSRAASTISRALSDIGFAVLRFDVTGLGDSEGTFEQSTFATNVSDLVAASAALRERLSGPSLLVGHSIGGTACLMAADAIPDVRAVVTIGAPANASHITRLFDDRLADIHRDGRATVSIGGRPFVIDRRFVDELEHAPLADRLANARRALLVFHSPLDNIVGVENAAEIFDAARHPKSFVSLDTADHLLSDRADGEYVASVTAAWARRYLPDVSPAIGGDSVPGTAEPRVDAETVRVTLEGPGRFTSLVRTHRHRLWADEPADIGGDDTGPSPYELLGAALGTCTAMTLRMFADRKDIPLDSVDVTVRHERVHVDDCAECESTSGFIGVLNRSIALTGALDEAQKALLMKIADRCPVHRTLEGEIRIRTAEATDTTHDHSE